MLVRVEACGVGLTVLNCMAGDLGDAPEDLPRVPGHELAGTIVETGAGVPKKRAGERVVAYELIRAARLGEGRVRPVVGARATIDDVDRIHGALRSGELLGRGALVFGEEEGE